MPVVSKIPKHLSIFDAILSPSCLSVLTEGQILKLHVASKDLKLSVVTDFVFSRIIFEFGQQVLKSNPAYFPSNLTSIEILPWMPSHKKCLKTIFTNIKNLKEIRIDSPVRFLKEFKPFSDKVFGLLNEAFFLF